MTSQELTGIIGALGFPIFLILAGIWIFVRYLWPWFTADQTQRRMAEAARHADYLTTYRQSTQAIEMLTKVFIEFTTNVNADHDNISKTVDANHGVAISVIEKNHSDIVRRLDKIDNKIPNGFGAKARD